jgi:transposase
VAPAPSIFIGIDVCGSSLDLARSDQPDVHSSFANDAAGIAQVLGLLAPLNPALIVVESTGKLEHPLLFALLDAGLTVSQVNPKRVRQFAYGIGQLAKTDPIDARMLMRFAQLAGPRLTERKAAHRVELAELLTCRRQLIETRTAHQNQLTRTASGFARTSLRSVLDCLRKRIERLDRQIEKLVDDDDDLRKLDELLRTVKGVGPILAATLISQLPELGKIGHAQLTALVGLAPYNRDSGTQRGKRTIRGGRTAVRNVIYMCTVAAIRHNPALKQMYTRLRDGGKASKVALVATARKFLRILNAIVRDNQPWAPKLVPET